MNRIDQKFIELKKDKKKAFIAFVTAGDPDLQTTKHLVVELERKGVDIIELGVPFSDPLADGPIIQKASMRALRKGVTLKKILGLVKTLRRTVKIPLVLMTYYNPVLQYGLRKFAVDAAGCGVDGIIVPDLPPEEADEFILPLSTKGLALIFLLAPTSTLARMKMVSAKSKGFIYYVSSTGITGPRESLPPQIHRDVCRIKKHAKLPVCVGFGVSRPDQAKAVVRWADGVIVGSAIVRELAGNSKSKDKIKKTVGFVARLVKAVKE